MRNNQEMGHNMLDTYIPQSYELWVPVWFVLDRLPAEKELAAWTQQDVTDWMEHCCRIERVVGWGIDSDGYVHAVTSALVRSGDDEIVFDSLGRSTKKDTEDAVLFWLIDRINKAVMITSKVEVAA